jgi:PilZ domain
VLGTQNSAQASSTDPVERRRGRRFNLRLGCRVCTVSTERVEFPGTVVNISRSGILVAFDLAQVAGVLGPDHEVRVVIDLPRHPLFSPRCLECTARVVRMVVAKAQTQVAFEIGQMQVTNQNPRGAAPREWLGGSFEGPIQ